MCPEVTAYREFVIDELTIKQPLTTIPEGQDGIIVNEIADPPGSGVIELRLEVVHHLPNEACTLEVTTQKIHQAVELHPNSQYYFTSPSTRGAIHVFHGSLDAEKSTEKVAERVGEFLRLNPHFLI